MWIVYTVLALLAAAIIAGALLSVGYRDGYEDGYRAARKEVLEWANKRGMKGGATHAAD